jgi:hypothetical protein
MAKNYFQQIIDECNKLDDLAEEFLKNRKGCYDKSTVDVWKENTELGYAWFKRCGEDFDKVPEVVAQIADGHTPYGPDLIEKNGSIAYSLGLSVVSIDAHAWRLNDFLKGKVDTPDLPFGILAKVE